MNAKKMLVVYLASTKAVLGVATRKTAGEPPVADLVGSGLPVRAPTMESGVAVAAADLKVKEVDYGDDVVRQPLNHVLDASGAVVLVTPTMTATSSSTNVAITLSGVVTADKSAIVVIDAGASRDPLKFTTKTTTLANINVPVTGVPHGSHDFFVSVEGYVSFLGTGSF